MRVRRVFVDMGSDPISSDQVSQFCGACAAALRTIVGDDDKDDIRMWDTCRPEVVNSQLSKWYAHNVKMAIPMLQTQPRVVGCVQRMHTGARRTVCATKKPLTVCMAGPGDSKVVREYREDDDSINVPKEKKQQGLYADQVPVRWPHSALIWRRRRAPYDTEAPRQHVT